MSLKNKLSVLYQKQQFNPSILGIFLNPFYFARKSLFKEINNFIPVLTGYLLDVGCGTKPYKKYCKNIYKYDGLEIDTPQNRQNKSADHFYDGSTFPFKNETFDSIMCNQVLEHVFTPEAFLKEIYRILKKDGKMLISVPFTWDEHEQPFDYARYSSFGLKHILAKSGFEIIEMRKTCNNFSIIFQLINAYIFKCLTSIRNFKLRLIIQMLLTTPFNILGIVSTILPINNDLYLDNVFLVKKKSINE